MKVLQDLGMAVQLSELHQESKMDKPSGTALAIAKKLSIPPELIRAERIGTSPRARHKLTFKISGLEIELLMKAKGRRLYVIGALAIAKKVATIGKRLGCKKHDAKQMLGI
jgi:dihydrodipicolinate reductase